MEIARLYWDIEREEIVVLVSPKSVRYVLEQVAGACDTVYSGKGAAVPVRIAKATNEAVKALAAGNSPQGLQQERKPEGGESDAAAAVKVAEPSTRISNADGAEAEGAEVVPAEPESRPSSRSDLFGGL